MENFFEYLTSNENRIAEIIHFSILATPELFNEREFRMLNDHITRHELQRQLPGIFVKITGEAADIGYIPTSEKISMKKQDEIFPRPYKRGIGITSPAIVIKNSLGVAKEVNFGADYLLAYQPVLPGQNFAMGVMRGPKVLDLMERMGDQWRIIPTLEDWDYHKEFTFSSNFDSRELNERFERVLNGFYEDSYDYVVERVNEHNARIPSSQS